MKKTIRFVLLLIMYISLFISAFGIISYFTDVEILASKIYQLFIGIAFLVISIMLFLLTFNTVKDDDEDQMVISDAELLQEAEKAERLDDDNEEYTDDTTVLSTTGIIEMAIKNATEENYEVSKNVVASVSEQKVDEKEAVKEQNDDFIETSALDEVEENDVLTAPLSLEEIAKAEAEAASEILEEVEEPALSETQRMYSEVESDLLNIVDRLDGIEVETDEILQDSKEDEIKQDTIESVEESSEELNETVEAIEDVVTDAIEAEEETVEDAIEVLETVQEAVENEEVDIIKEEAVEYTAEASLELSKTSMDILNVDSVEVENASTTELAQLEQEEEIAKDYQPIIDGFLNAVDHINDEPEQLVVQAQKLQDVVAKTIPDGLTNTQMIYINDSDNSYIDENGIPQLKITDEINVNYVTQVDEEFAKIEQQRAKKAQELAQAEREADEYEREERISTITGWLIAIMVILILACIGLGAFYLISRKLI